MRLVWFKQDERFVAASRLFQALARRLRFAAVEFECGEAHFGVSDVGGECGGFAQLRRDRFQQRKRAFRAGARLGARPALSV